MTYCMESSGQSPSGHVYTLSSISGKRAKLIRELNLKALPRFSYKDVQILSWSLQAGLSYEEFTAESKQIVDEVLPEFRSQLNESLISKIEQEWNSTSQKSAGIIPSFDSASNILISELGEVGKKINDAREFRNLIKRNGNDYASLSSLISTSSKSSSSEPQWSKISDFVYARFVTNGHYQQIGYLQIRVLANTRQPTSASDQKVSVDITSLQADPLVSGIQPLSFSALYGYSGVLIIPALADAPLAAGLVLGAVLAAKVIDWDAFSQLSEILKSSKEVGIRKDINRGSKTLSEIHDKLEKPLKDSGIVSGKDLTSKKNSKTRQYEKKGGQTKLDEDFAKLPGESIKTQDNKDVKTLPNGNKAIKRPASEDDGIPTLEIQPPYGKERIKVRYPLK